jgi:uncharacterized alpha/beta hydrolase family protein
LKFFFPIFFFRFLKSAAIPSIYIQKYSGKQSRSDLKVTKMGQQINLTHELIVWQNCSADFLV